MESHRINIWRQLDWVTVLLYLLLVLIGWVSIYAASYDFDNASIFSFDERSGKQLLWILLSLAIGSMVLLVDSRFFETYAYPIYAALLLLLLVTIVIAPEIKGSRSWLVIGPVSLQPAEFAKFATALALARLFNGYNFVLTTPQNMVRALLIMFLPMFLILAQNETGSALVYASLFLMLYREGMSGLVLCGAFYAVLFFVVGIKYSDVLWGVTSVGELFVLLLIGLAVLVYFLTSIRDLFATRNVAIILSCGVVVTVIIGYFFPRVSLLYFSLATLLILSLYVLIFYLQQQNKKLLIIPIFVVGSVLYLFSVNYVFHSLLKPHQRVRIEVLLDIKEDLRGAGYNVNQSIIAIGSGGFSGKGILNGTQTKLKYVPEQDTDFIFCTIGEEEGFLGTSFVLCLFLALILRTIYLAERQRTHFGRVFAYCVASIIFFHVAINIGMVTGLCPVIGIPLPFISYGGSSLWGFSLLIFILLRIDAGRLERL